MITRIARILSLALIFGLLFGIRPAIADGLSLPKLFPDNKTETKKVSMKQKTQPSMLDKMTTGTKKFFTNVGDTLTFKKTTPPKQAAMPSNPYFKPPKEEKSSWFSSTKEEPKTKKTPSDWVGQPRLEH